jgi:glutamate carboxypeptidase
MLLASDDQNHRSHQAISQRLPEMWTLLEQWVNVNSFTGNINGCNQMADLLGHAFALPGLHIEHYEPGAGHQAGRHLGFASDLYLSGRPGVLLIGHHDTVFPPGTFEGFTNDGIVVKGPGVLDMKGGIAVVWAALAALSDMGLLPQMSVAFASVSDEETGSVDGSRVLTQLARNAASCLVFEAGRMADAIVVARKGTGKITVTAHGKAAHAGNDLAAGINAIVALSQWIERAARLTAADGSVTVNVGLVQGGTSANTVPALAKCEVDIRLVQQIDGERVIADMRQIADEITSLTRARFEFTGGIRRSPLQLTDANAKLAKEYGQCATAHGLGATLAPLMGGGSDANTMAALGIPAIDGLGPRGKGFHTHDEYAEVVTFEPKVRALVDFLRATAQLRS